MSKHNIMFGNRIFINTSWIIGANITQMVLSVIIGVISARFLGPTNYGIINIGAAYTAIFIPICTLGIPNIYVNEIKTRPNEEASITSTSIALRILMSIISVILITAIVSVNSDSSRTLIIVTFVHSLSLIFQSSNIIELWYQARLRSRVPAIITTAAYVIMSGYKIWLLITRKSVEWFAFSITLETIVISIAYLFLYRRNSKKKFVWSTSEAKRLIGSSYHFILSGLVVVIGTQISKVILGVYLDSISVGLYSAAAVVASLHGFVVNAIIVSMRPYIIECKRDRQDIYVQRLTQLYSVIVWLGLIATVAYLFIGRQLVILLYGNAYSSAGASVVILSLFVPISYLGVARNIWCVCEKKQKYEKYIALVSTIGIILLDILFIPSMGVKGAAMAIFLSSLFGNIVLQAIIPALRENYQIIIMSINPKHLLRLFAGASR